MVLLLKAVSKGLLTNELSSLLEQSLLPVGFQNAIETLVKFLLKSGEYCSKTKWLSNVCSHFLQSHTLLLL